MNNSNISIGHALSQGLRLSSDEVLEQEIAKETQRTSYRRTYWQKWNKLKKRVFGTITNQEHAELKSRADAAGRSCWGQVLRQFSRLERLVTQYADGMRISVSSEETLFDPRLSDHPSAPASDNSAAHNSPDNLNSSDLVAEPCMSPVDQITIPTANSAAFGKPDPDETIVSDVTRLPSSSICGTCGRPVKHSDLCENCDDH